MSRRACLYVVGLSLSLLLFAGFNSPSSYAAGEIGELQVERTTITLQPDCQPGTQPTSTAAPGSHSLADGLAVSADGLGRAQLLLDGGGAIVIYHDSCLEFVGTGASDRVLRLAAGTLSVNGQGAQVRIEADGTEIETTGQVFVHRNVQRKSTWIVAQQGSVQVKSGGAQVSLSSGQQTWAEQGRRPVAPKKASRDAVGARFFLIDDLTNGVLAEADLLAVGGGMPWGWLAGLLVLLVAAAVVAWALGRSRKRVPRAEVGELAGLRPVLASGHGNLIPLRGRQITVGRIPGNGLVLRDPRVSSRHARLLSSPEGWVLEDLNSRNGSFVNDQRITRTRLHEGDVIRFGQTAFAFQIGVGPAPARPSKHPTPIPARADETPAARELAPRPQPVRGAAPAGIRVVQAEGLGPFVGVDRDGLTIGREDDNELVLRDPRVSGNHARVVLREEGYVIEDLRSTNGTFVNGQRVASHVLVGGERIQLGDTRLVFEVRQPGEVTS